MVDKPFSGATVDLLLWVVGHQHGKKSLNCSKKPVLHKEYFCDDGKFLDSIHFIN